MHAHQKVLLCFLAKFQTQQIITLEGQTQNYQFLDPTLKSEALRKSISYNGAKVWNDLPENFRQIESLASLKVSLKEPLSLTCKLMK